MNHFLLEAKDVADQIVVVGFISSATLGFVIGILFRLYALDRKLTDIKNRLK
jgi:hypothetical protein